MMDPTISSFGMTLAVKATLVLGAASIASLAMRRASASAHHLLWTLAFGALALLPALSAVAVLEDGPRIEIPIGPLTRSPATPSPVPSARSTSAALPPASAEPPAAERTASSAPPRVRAASGWLALMGLWALGAAALVGRVALGLGAGARTRRRATELTEPAWAEALDAARERLSVRQRVALRRADAAQLPFTLGLLRPTVVLPEASRRYSPRRRWAVLLHELAHVRRRDCWTQLVGQLACAAFWWHPLAWLGLRRMRALGERAADDLVLVAGARASDYAHELLELARGLHRERLTPLASVTMAHRARFEERLLALLDPALARAAVTSRRASAAGLLALLLVLGLAISMPTRMAPTVRAAAPTVVREEAAPSPQEAESPAAAPSSEAPVEEEAHEEEAGVSERSQTAPSSSAAEAADARARAREALAGALDDPESSVRQEALHALARFGDATVAPALERALSDDEADIRARAAWGLGRLRVEAAVPALIHALTDPAADVRAQAAWALGLIRDPRALEGLSAALRDDSGDVRAQAAWALGLLRDPGSVEALVGALDDEATDVRREAAWALGLLRDPRAVDGLSRALHDEDAEVREQAAWALGLLAGGDDGEDLDVDLDLDLDAGGETEPDGERAPPPPGQGPVL